MKELINATNKIGDGKLPNHYWVSIANDYAYYNPETQTQEWIGELKLFKSAGKIVAVFDTYKAARAYAEDEIGLGMVVDDIRVNQITIEDRISGEVYSNTYVFDAETAAIDNFINVDIGFTRSEMTKRGVKFI